MINKLKCITSAVKFIQIKYMYLLELWLLRHVGQMKLATQKMKQRKNKMSKFYDRTQIQLTFSK
jgi:hypothetical protein